MTYFKNFASYKKLAVSVSNYNNGEEITLDEIKAQAQKVNNDSHEATAKNLAQHFIKNKKEAFEALIKNPFYPTITLKINKDTEEVEEIARGKNKFVKLAKIESIFKSLVKENETLKHNKSIFGGLAFYQATKIFTRNLLKDRLEVDEAIPLNLEKAKIDEAEGFTAQDTEIFASNSKNKIQEQLRLLSKFFYCQEHASKMVKSHLAIFKTACLRLGIGEKMSLKEVDAKPMAQILMIYLYHIVNGISIEVNASNKEVIATL